MTDYSVWFAENNFTPDGITYQIIPDEGHTINDNLVDNLSFSYAFGYHTNALPDLPPGYTAKAISFFDYFIMTRAGIFTLSGQTPEIPLEDI